MSVTGLKKRIVPKLLIKHRQMGRSVRPVLVTTQGYDKVMEIGDAVSQAKIYQAQLADDFGLAEHNRFDTGRQRAKVGERRFALARLAAHCVAAARHARAAAAATETWTTAKRSEGICADPWHAEELVRKGCAGPGAPPTR